VAWFLQGLVGGRALTGQDETVQMAKQKPWHHERRPAAQ